MDETQSGSDSTAQSDIVERTAAGEGALTAREAARSLADTRHKDRAGAERPRDEEEKGDARAGARVAEQESPEQSGGAAQQVDDNHDDLAGPGETQGADPAAQQPSIEPPRSWTKEDKELFKGLPRATQERLVERERSREADFLRRQNEAAEKTKGLSAKETAAEQMRAYYEQALPTLLQSLQDQQAGQFADVQSVGDVEKMAREDWPRYVQWDAQQKRIAAIQQQVQAAVARQTIERTQRWHTFASDEDAKFAEKASDLADTDAKLKAASSAADMLREMGFSDAELGALWSGQRDISLRDHRIQLLIRDGLRYRDAQRAAKSPHPRPVPHVQRPGAAPARNADADGRVKDLTERLNATGNVRDAAALLAARRAAQRR